MKKLLSIMLSIMLILSICPVAFAQTETEDYSQYPLILVPGYSSTKLYYEDENGDEVMAWEGLDAGILTYLLEDIVDVGMSVAPLAQGNAKEIARIVGENFLECYGDIKCDKNGKSIKPLKRVLTEPEECKASVLGEKQYEKEIAGHFSQYLDEGLDNVYNFTSDFRMGAVECAGQLYQFVEDVLDYTGAEKVNIFAVSHGGQVTGTYLSLYAKEGDAHAGRINNVVMTVPALGGAGFAYDALNGGIELDLDGILTFVEHGEMLEEDYHWLLQAKIFGFLDDIVEELLPYVHELMGYWGSMWDFVPLEYYDDLKAKFFDAEESKDLIEQSDYMHYEVMPYFAENFASCQRAGADVSIIAGHNYQIVTGLQDDSDAIITTKAATGAITAPMGKRFADGYTQKVDTGFYQVSPSMTVDASTSYLPENTWFVEGLYHGMTYKDAYVTDLMTKLLLTEEIKSVNDKAEYPQFKATQNKSHDVFARFDSSKDGYLSSEDTKLIITNISTKYEVKLLAVTSPDCPELKLPSLASKVLAPGESVEVAIRGEVPKVSLKNIDIVVDYYMAQSITPVGERVFNFTILNGEPVVFDEKNPLVDASSERGAEIEDMVGNDGFAAMDKLGIVPFLKIIYNVVMNILSYVFDFVETFRGISK